MERGVCKIKIYKVLKSKYFATDCSFVYIALQIVFLFIFYFLQFCQYTKIKSHKTLALIPAGGGGGGTLMLLYKGNQNQVFVAKLPLPLVSSGVNKCYKY